MTATNPTLEALRRGDLAGARELRLGGTRLDAFPREVFGLADTLEVLDLGATGLDGLPDDLGRLGRLRALFCSGNPMDRLPPALGGCPALEQLGFRGCGLREVPGEALPPRLRWLTLTDNALAALPDALGDRPLLQKLMLAGNRLDALPDGLAGAGRLELVRLAANRFAALPPWLPELPGLAWAAWAGNPCENPTFGGDAGPAGAGVDALRWADLDLGALLGEGASGRIHAATWREGAEDRPVAVKMFKGAMTSDGLPEREMAACLAAGAHPHLAGALGRVLGHPGGTPALAMPLLPRGWRALAGPPSPASCSRDVYDDGLAFAPEAARKIARGIAAAAGHLHDRGLSHGDLYAHNVLWDGGAGEAVLTDFGAASALPPGAEGARWRRVEVRAFGILLGEILDRAAGLDHLRPLQAACASPDAGARPAMADVVRALAA